MLNSIKEIMVLDSMAKAAIVEKDNSKHISMPKTISRAERNKRKKREKMKKHSRIINR